MDPDNPPLTDAELAQFRPHAKFLERRRFDDWIASRSGRVTGWMTWCASLAASDYPAEGSRSAFDVWLDETRREAGRTTREWDLFDAWQAGVSYVERVMGTSA